MPEPSDRRLFLVAPGEVAILAVELLWNNLECAKHRNGRWSHKFSGHLRILDIGRAALRATNQGSGNIRISRLPLDHEALGLLKIVVFHHYFRIGLRARHEANLLQRRFIMNIGV